MVESGCSASTEPTALERMHAAAMRRPTSWCETGLEHPLSVEVVLEARPALNHTPPTPLVNNQMSNLQIGQEFNEL